MSNLSSKDGLHNSHVVLFYSLLCRQAERMKRFMRQLHYYTLYKLEIGEDPRD